MSDSIRIMRNPIAEIAFNCDPLRNMRDYLKIKSWRQAGKPVPPPNAVKRSILSSYIAASKAAIFIETGTLFGDMDFAFRNHFKDIFSIELNEELCKRAVHRFRSFPHIHILQGDSGLVLPQILKNISSNCLFWLDGHYSGGITANGGTETPIIMEMKTILGHEPKGHVILIDDARCFDGTHDYPILRELQELVTRNRPDYAFSALNDVIRIHPRWTSLSEF